MRVILLDSIDDIFLSAILRKEKSVNVLITFITFFASLTNAKFGLIPDAFLVSLTLFVFFFNLVRDVLVTLLKVRFPIYIGPIKLSANATSIMISLPVIFALYFGYASKLIPNLPETIYAKIVAAGILILLSIIYQVVYYLGLSYILYEVEETGDYRILILSLIILYVLTLLAVRAFYDGYVSIVKYILKI